MQTDKSEREKFELWARKFSKRQDGISYWAAYDFNTNSDGEYVELGVRTAYWSWQAHAESVAPDQQVIRDCSMLLKTCAQKLRKQGDPFYADKIADFLVRKNIQGSILRAAESLSGAVPEDKK